MTACAGCEQCRRALPRRIARDAHDGPRRERRAQEARLLQAQDADAARSPPAALQRQREQLQAEARP